MTLLTKGEAASHCRDGSKIATRRARWPSTATADPSARLMRTKEQRIVASAAEKGSDLRPRCRAAERYNAKLVNRQALMLSSSA
jgi:hypothetical protein